MAKLMNALFKKNNFIQHIHLKILNNFNVKCFQSAAAINTIIDPAFELTNDQIQLQNTAYNFAMNEFRPYMKEWDEKQYLPRDQMKKGAELGFAGLNAPIDFGGSDLSRLEASIVFEALSQGCVSTTAMLTLHNMCVNIINKFANDELKNRFLADLIKFEKMASYCLTEPGAGSDAANLRTSAKLKDGYYVVNGSKAFISGGGESEVYLVICRTGSSGPKGISCLLIEKGTEGLSFGKKEQKLGWNSQPTRAVIFEDCKVPAENLIGEIGQGFRIAMDGLNSVRLYMSSCSLGAAQYALEETIVYTSDRKQFDRPLISFQNTQFKLAALASELLASRLILRSVARRIDSELETDNDINYSSIPLPSVSAAGKLIATEKAFYIIDECLQLYGGYGYLKDFPLQQLLRDSRVHRIIGGTKEIMQMIISRDFMNKK